MAGVVVHVPAGLLRPETHDELYLVGYMSGENEVHLKTLTSCRDAAPPGLQILGRVCREHGELRFALFYPRNITAGA